jgi:23S rRNA (uridine2552-2'-O)-methyltransferase
MERLKREKRRKPSSRAWLERQINDPYVTRAKREGFRSRAAFKLAEIDEKYHLFRGGMRVVDLGAAPGGWSEVAARRIGTGGRVIALDILEMKPIAGVEFLALDFLDEAAPQRLKAMLGDTAHGKVDVVLSDMAANTTGHRPTDHLRIMALAEAAAHFAREVLGAGGSFLCKVLQGGTEAVLLAELKRDFDSVKHVKPPASRSDSAELYLLARGFRGGMALRASSTIRKS